MPKKYLYHVLTWKQDAVKSNIPTISVGHFEFFAKTDELGKATLIVSLLDKAGHLAIATRSGDPSVQQLKQLQLRYPQRAFELSPTESKQDD